VAAKRSGEDVVMVGPALPSGGHVVLRKRGASAERPWEAFAMRPMEEGKPLHGELVKLAPRAEPHLYDVEVLHDARVRSDDVEPSERQAARPAEKERGRPAQVATDDYRRGWSRLFAKKSLPS
jgi:hypothetical protein